MSIDMNKPISQQKKWFKWMVWGAVAFVIWGVGWEATRQPVDDPGKPIKLDFPPGTITKDNSSIVFTKNPDHTITIDTPLGSAIIQHPVDVDDSKFVAPNAPAVVTGDTHLDQLRSQITANKYDPHELARMYSEWCQTRECEGTTYQDMLDDLELRDDLSKLRKATQ